MKSTKRIGVAGALAVSMFALLAIPTADALEKTSSLVRAETSRPVQFDVFLPLQNAKTLDALIDAQHTQGSPQYHKWLTPAEFKERFGPSKTAIDAVSKELTASGFTVTAIHAHGVRVSGTVKNVEAAFSTRLMAAHTATGKEALKAAQPLTLTSTMLSYGAVVSTFTDTPRMHRMAQRLGKVDPDNRRSPTGDYWFDDLKQAYQYPSYQSLTGKGTTIGILMTGAYQASDMTKYFSHEKLRMPKIEEVDVFGGAPYDPNGSFETHLDIQQSGGMAPNATIVLYNIPDLSDMSILAGLTDIVESNRADVVNMSFGGFENQYSKAYSFNNGVDQFGILTVYDDLFKQGNAQGITFVASSGDLGALEAVPPACFEASTSSASCGKFYANANSPASSPHVTGVGGTNLVTTYDANNPKDLNSAYVRENAYDDPLAEDIFYGTTATGAVWGSGGGISQYYPKPSYQGLVSTGSAKYRTVPDLSLHMGGCPIGAVTPCGPDRSADIAAIDGTFYGVIGTSASAPDFTGLLALKIESLGTRLGNENYEIYSLAAAQATGSGLKVFRPAPAGYNGLYHTHAGYNLVLGNGTLYATSFLLKPKLPVSGVPQTISNP